MEKTQGFNHKLSEWMCRLSELSVQFPDLTEQLVYINNKIACNENLEEKELMLISRVFCNFTLLNLIIEKNKNAYENMIEFLSQ